MERLNSDFQTWKPTSQLFKEVLLLMLFATLAGLAASFLGAMLLNWLG